MAAINPESLNPEPLNSKFKDVGEFALCNKCMGGDDRILCSALIKIFNRNCVECLYRYLEFFNDCSSVNQMNLRFGASRGSLECIQIVLPKVDLYRIYNIECNIYIDLRESNLNIESNHLFETSPLFSAIEKENFKTLDLFLDYYIENKLVLGTNFKYFYLELLTFSINNNRYESLILLLEKISIFIDLEKCDEFKMFISLYSLEKSFLCVKHFILWTQRFKFKLTWKLIGLNMEVIRDFTSLELYSYLKERNVLSLEQLAFLEQNLNPSITKPARKNPYS